MRIAGWLFVVCAIVSALGVFMPSVEVQLGGVGLGKRGSLSLYQAHRSREVMRELVASYGRVPGRRLGEALAAAAIPRLHARAHEYVDDATSAMTTLDDVHDADVTLLDTVVTSTIWAFLAIVGLAIAIVFGETVRDRFRPGRVVVALVLAVLATAVASAVCLIWRRAVWEANDELGVSTLAVAYGAYVMPIAAGGSVLAAIAMLVRRGPARATALP